MIDITGLSTYKRNLELLADKSANLFDLFTEARNHSQRGEVTLSAADIIAMNATPVDIIAAPGAGFYTVVDQIILEMTRTSTQFTGGGVVTFQYSGGAVVHSSSIPASVITGAAGVVHTLLAQNTGANGITVPENTKVTITNATGAFAAGTGTAKVKIIYRTVAIG